MKRSRYIDPDFSSWLMNKTRVHKVLHLKNIPRNSTEAQTLIEKYKLFYFSKCHSRIIVYWLSDEMAHLNRLHTSNGRVKSRNQQTQPRILRTIANLLQTHHVHGSNRLLIKICLWVWHRMQRMNPKALALMRLSSSLQRESRSLEYDRFRIN